MTTDDGNIWAQTVEGGGSAVVRAMETRGPVGADLDRVIAGAVPRPGPPGDLDLAGAHTAAWREQRSPIRSTTSGPSGVEAELDAGIFARFKDVGPTFEHAPRSTQFRYNEETQQLLAFQFIPHQGPLRQLAESTAHVVAFVSPADAERISGLDLTPESGQEGIECVLHHALRAQIGMPPPDHGRAGVEPVAF